MNILLIGVAIEGGGAEQVIVDLARGLQGRGHDVMVAFLEGTDMIVPALEAEGIACRRLLKRSRFAAGPVADCTPSCIAHLRRTIREFKPDIIDAHVPRPTMWAALAHRLLHVRPPFVYTEHNIQSAYPGWAKWVYRLFLPVTDHVIAISQAGADSFKDRWRWPEERVTRIWNGIDVGRVLPTQAVADVRESLGTPGTTRVMCNVGNVTTRKAQEVLVRAMAELHPELPEVPCWIAGSLELEPQTATMVRAEIASHGLGDAVHVLGPRRDVPNLIAAADVFVLSSRKEGFPITILEAMAAGKPVVATDVGGCAEAVVHGETGLIVPPEDPHALAEALKWVLMHPEEARRMGEAGRRRVKANFTVDAMVEQHLAVYEKAIATER